MSDAKFAEFWADINTNSPTILTVTLICEIIEALKTTNPQALKEAADMVAMRYLKEHGEYEETAS